MVSAEHLSDIDGMCALLMGLVVGVRVPGDLVGLVLVVTYKTGQTAHRILFYISSENSKAFGGEIKEYLRMMIKERKDRVGVVSDVIQYYNMFQKIKGAELVTLLLLITEVLSVTSLTTSNCPTSYDFASANVTADSSNSLANLIYGNLYSAEEQATLSLSYSQGDTKTVKKYMAQMQIVAPFIVLGVAFALTFLIALCCCVFQKSCPPCQSLKRDYAARPYQKFQMKCVTFFTVLFAFGIALTTIIGFVYFPALEKDIKMTKCTLYYSLDIALNGDLSNGWGGFTQLANQIGNISNQLTTTSTAINANISNSEWIITDLNALRQQNVNLYTKNNQSTVYSPNPTTTAAATSANTALPTVTPLFISSGLGPYTTNNTMTYDISQGIESTTAKLANQGYKVFKAAQMLSNSANNIQTNTNINLQSFSMNSNYYDATTVSLNQFSADIFDSLFNWALYLIQAILAFVMISSIFILIGVIATHCCDILSCKTCVHLGWVTYGITYFGIVVMAFFFFSMGGLSYSFCQFYGGMIKTKTSYTSFTATAKPTSFNRIFQKLNICFFGNGSITSSFLLNNQMQTVSTLYAEISTYLAMTNSSLSTYVDMTASPTKINGWINAMKKYQSGIYIDASSGLTTEDNPQTALRGMNTYTYYGNGGVIPICTADLWVFDTANCTYSSNQTIYSVANGTTNSSTGFLCISFNEKPKANSTTIWTVSDIADRYIPQRQCQGTTQAYESMFQYAQSLINYRDSRMNLYQNLQDQLTSLLASNNAFNTKMTGYTASVNAFTQATATLNSLVTNQINGVDYSSNCTTIANSLRLFYNVFCVNFIYKSVQFGICCLVLLGIMIGGMLTGNVFGIRYGRLEKTRKIVMPQLPVLSSDLHSETFQKRQKSSESSSSDDD